MGRERERERERERGSRKSILSARHDDDGYRWYICIQLNGFKYCYLIRIILLKINPLLAHG